jgi:hypothetical protein
VRCQASVRQTSTTLCCTFCLVWGLNSRRREHCAKAGNGHCVPIRKCAETLVRYGLLTPSARAGQDSSQCPLIFSKLMTY